MNDGEFMADELRNEWLETDNVEICWNGDALEVSFYFLIEMAFLVCAPLKVNMEPKNHLIEKDNHLPNLHF